MRSKGVEEEEVVLELLILKRAGVVALHGAKTPVNQPRERDSSRYMNLCALSKMDAVTSQIYTVSVLKANNRIVVLQLEVQDKLRERRDPSPCQYSAWISSNPHPMWFKKLRLSILHCFFVVSRSRTHCCCYPRI